MQRRALPLIAALLLAPAALTGCGTSAPAKKTNTEAEAQKTVEDLFGPAPASQPAADPNAPRDTPDKSCDHWRNDVHRKLVEQIPGAVQLHGSSLIGVGQCYYSEKGVWIVGLQELVGEKDAEDKVGLRGKLQATYFDVASKTEWRADPSLLRDPWDGAGEGFVATQAFTIWPTSEVRDLDGDGVHEFALRFGRTIEGAYQGEQIKLFQAKDGRVVPYPKTEGTVIDGLEDVNNDNRLDLLAKPFRAQDPCYGNQTFAAAADFAAIGQPDGSFDWKHPDALARLRSRCEAKPSSLIPEDKQDSFFTTVMLERVACARVWGVSEAEIMKTVDKVLAAPDEYNTKSCPVAREVFLRWAKITPPQTLR